MPCPAAAVCSGLDHGRLPDQAVPDGHPGPRRACASNGVTLVRMAAAMSSTPAWASSTR